MFLHYTTSVSQISIPPESTRQILPLVRLQTLAYSKPDFDSSFCTRRPSIYGYATSLQNTIWLQGMIPASRRESIPSCSMLVRLGRGRSVVRVDNSEVMSMKCDPRLRLRSKVVFVEATQIQRHNWTKQIPFNDSQLL